jgi:acyl-CoA thioesterase I
MKTSSAGKRMETPRAHNSLKRIALIPVCVVFLFGSLLTFPNALPWMMLVWILVAGGFNWAQKSAEWPLATLVVIVFVKNPEWSVAMIVFIGVCLLATVAYWIRRQATGIVWWPLLLLMVAWVYFWIDFGFSSGKNYIRTVAGRDIVVCLGDSLTDYGYPQELEKLIVQPVADFGFDGILSKDGVDQLDEIVALKPRAVVLELGGHDYNRGLSRAVARQNLAEIIATCRINDIEVVIVEIPRGFIRDPWCGLERGLAREYDLTLISDTLIRRFVFFSPLVPPGIWLPEDQHLSNDGLHPNKLGNKAFAEAVAESISRYIDRRH